jgi:hypothetical protein
MASGLETTPRSKPRAARGGILTAACRGQTNRIGCKMLPIFRQGWLTWASRNRCLSAGKPKQGSGRKKRANKAVEAGRKTLAKQFYKVSKAMSEKPIRSLPVPAAQTRNTYVMPASWSRRPLIWPRRRTHFTSSRIG